MHLKKFLKIRDTHEAYASVRGSGRVGIPMIMVGDEARMLGGEDTLVALMEEFPQWVQPAV